MLTTIINAHLEGFPIVFNDSTGFETLKDLMVLLSDTDYNISRTLLHVKDGIKTKVKNASTDSSLENYVELIIVNQK